MARQWTPMLNQMRILHPRRLVYASMILMVIVYVDAIILLALARGCAVSVRLNSGIPRAYHVRLCAPFDNMGESGPDFLVGPPSESETGIYGGRYPNIDKLAVQ
jgi:hypothetical protein